MTHVRRFSALPEVQLRFIETAPPCCSVDTRPAMGERRVVVKMEEGTSFLTDQKIEPTLCEQILACFRICCPPSLPELPYDYHPYEMFQKYLEIHHPLIAKLAPLYAKVDLKKMAENQTPLLVKHVQAVEAVIGGWPALKKTLKVALHHLRYSIAQKMPPIKSENLAVPAPSLQIFIGEPPALFNEQKLGLSLSSLPLKDKNGSLILTPEKMHAVVKSVKALICEVNSKRAVDGRVYLCFSAFVHFVCTALQKLGYTILLPSILDHIPVDGSKKDQVDHLLQLPFDSLSVDDLAYFVEQLQKKPVERRLSVEEEERKV